MKANGNKSAGTVSALGFSLLLQSALLAGDWPQWRGPNRDGVWTETGLAPSFPAGRLTPAWRTPLGRGWSSPVVAHGRVYVTDVELRAPTAEERVICLDASNGRRLWTHRYAAAYPDWAFDPNAGGPRATPIVREGRLFTLGATGQLFCLDATTGLVVWKRDLATDYQVKEFTGITASPLIEDRLLILYICGKPDACVVALDHQSGREVWRALADAFSYSSPIVITAGGRRQLIVWTQDAVTSLNPDTGNVWWREPFPTPGDQAVATPVFADDRLLVAGLMFQLDSHRPSASVLWPELKTGARRILSNTSTPLLRGGCIYSATTSGELICLEASSGRPIWRTNSVTELKNGASIHLTPCGQAVILFTDRGELIRAELTAQGYREFSRAQLLEPTSPFGDRKCAWVPPAYANGHVFARSDAELVCVSLRPTGSD